MLYEVITLLEPGHDHHRKLETLGVVGGEQQHPVAVIYTGSTTTAAVDASQLTSYNFV